uniref:Uncharacterized protein n=1 Tax=Bracon brevicornis TaxID=1563983 RepID=A0A6V7KXN3_9HYME
MTCRVLNTMSSMCSTESPGGFARNSIEFPTSYPTSYNSQMRIGIEPIAVPYTRTNIETERLGRFIADNNGNASNVNVL